MKNLTKGTLIASLLLVSASSNAEKFDLVVKEKSLAATNTMSSPAKNKQKTHSFESISIEASTLEEAIALAKQSGKYDSVEIDVSISTTTQPKPLSYNVHQQSFIQSAPNDPYFSEQRYWLEKDYGHYTAAANNILEAFQIQVPYAPIRVGVIDGGFFDDFQDIKATGISFVGDPVVNQFVGDNYLSPEDDRECENGHGTAIMGIIGSESNDDYGIAGIAKVDLVAIRAMRCGTGKLSDVAKAIRYLIGESVDGLEPLDRPVNIINISLGAHIDEAPPSYIQDAIDAATALGVTVVAAGGNFNKNVSNFYPANADGVVSVAAISAETGDKFKTSNYGQDLDIAAQGSYIASYALNIEKVGYWDETSFSTSIVTGVMALAYQAAPNVDPKTLLELMKLSSYSLDNSVDCQLYGCGAGLLNAKTFIDSAIAYEKQDFGTIKHVLSETELCNKAVYLTSNNVKARLCASYKVNINVGDNDSQTNIAIYQAPKGEVMTFDNAEIIANVDSKNIILSGLDVDIYSYGYTNCKSGNCATGIILPLSASDAEKPSVCD